MKYYKKTTGFRITFIFMCFLGLIMLFCNKVYAAPVINRLYGPNRYKTSIEISKKNWTTADNVILADGNSYADALCAAPFSKKINAPIILLNKDINEDVKNELVRLKTKKVYIIGGTGVISSNAEEKLKSLKLQYERISGSNRYETSIEIARKITSNNIFVVAGNNFPDALSVGSAAGINNIPILMVEKKSNDKINAFVKSRNLTKTYVIGGPSVVSEDAVKSFSNVERIYGKNRYSTNYMVLSKFFNKTLNSAYITYGGNFPDALCGSAAAIKDNAPIVLVNTELYKDTVPFLKSKIITDGCINVLGGTSIVKTSSVVPLTGLTGKYKVCIDPGDGGSEYGVKALNNVYEKNINLNVALKLGKMLSENGISVVYTRTTDKTLSDSERIKIANSNNCDLYISINCNNFSTSTPNGIETLYQNGSYISKNLAGLVQNSLIEYTGMTNRESKSDTSHKLLQGTYCPSAMAMIGFLSNKSDEQKLLSSSYQNKFAQGITKGIVEYFMKYRTSNIKISSFNDIYKTINVGQTYILPATINALMSNNTYKKLNVTWNTTTVNNNTSGTYRYTGIVDGSNKKIALILKVTGGTKPDDGKITICLDAGHGGYDPGAIGSGTMEKNVTLAVALKTGSILAANNIKVVYTRTSDSVSWPSNESKDLQVRCDIAKKYNSDYYVSIHCNSFKPSAHGIETFYCSANNTKNESQKLAAAVQAELIKKLKSEDRGVKDYIYYVNKYASCPSILTEIGFITNSTEGNLLKTATYQNKVAQAIAEGILNFLKK